MFRVCETNNSNNKYDNWDHFNTGQFNIYGFYDGARGVILSIKERFQYQTRARVGISESLEVAKISIPQPKRTYIGKNNLIIMVWRLYKAWILASRA